VQQLSDREKNESHHGSVLTSGSPGGQVPPPVPLLSGVSSLIPPGFAVERRTHCALVRIQSGDALMRDVRHPTEEHGRIRSGEFLVGSATAGREQDDEDGRRHGVDRSEDAPFRDRASPTVLGIRANGPLAMTYVNAADDPRTTK
jgi:hypothetical protein